MVVIDNLDNSCKVALDFIKELGGKFCNNLHFNKMDLCKIEVTSMRCFSFTSLKLSCTLHA